MAWIGSPSELMALGGLGPSSLVFWPTTQTSLPYSGPFALPNEIDFSKSNKISPPEMLLQFYHEVEFWSKQIHLLIHISAILYDS